MSLIFRYYGLSFYSGLSLLDTLDNLVEEHMAGISNAGGLDVLKGGSSQDLRRALGISCEHLS